MIRSPTRTLPLLLFLCTASQAPASVILTLRHDAGTDSIHWDLRGSYTVRRAGPFSGDCRFDPCGSTLLIPSLNWDTESWSFIEVIADMARSDLELPLGASISILGASGGELTLSNPSLSITSGPDHDLLTISHAPADYPEFSRGDTLHYSGFGTITDAPFSSLNPGQSDFRSYGHHDDIGVPIFIVNIIPEPHTAALLLLAASAHAFRRRRAPHDRHE